MLNAYQAFDTNSIRPVTVQVHFLKPISYEEYQGMIGKENKTVFKRYIFLSIYINLYPAALVGVKSYFF